MVSVAREPMLDTGTLRRALSGFFLSGLLFSLVGAMLPAWGYHLSSSYSLIGMHFLGVSAGILASVRTSQALLPARGVSFVLTLGASLACGGLLFLAAVSGPQSPWWRVLGMAWIGFSAGLINTAVFHAISTAYHHEPAATVNLAGALFGLGCLVSALLVAGTYYVYTVPSILILLATAPGFAAVFYARWPFAPRRRPEEPTLRQALEDFKSPAAVLFTVLLFFQFGNEWSIAGWLPLFLTQSLGISPESSLLMLALYWTSLLVGRVAAQSVLARVSHARLLMASVVAAMLGCAILGFTKTQFGAAVGILLVGLGYASIYPLVVESIGHRFPYYHPGFFNGIFSLALTGGLIAPWMLGHFAEWWGIRAVMLLPMAGSAVVFLLLLSIWLEAKMAEGSPRPIA